MTSRNSLTRVRCTNAFVGLTFGLLCTLFTAVNVAASETDRLSLHRLSSYEVISNKVIIIKASGKKSYRVDLFPGCIGVRHAHTLAFQTRGGKSLDKFSSVVLPDGTRCRFKSFAFMPQLPEEPLQGDIQSPGTSSADSTAAE